MRCRRGRAPGGSGSPRMSRAGGLGTKPYPACRLQSSPTKDARPDIMEKDRPDYFAWTEAFFFWIKTSTVIPLRNLSNGPWGPNN